MSIPNLNKQEAHKDSYHAATYATITATKTQDALMLNKAAQMWRELGENETADKCDGLIRLWQLAENERIKNV